MAGASGNKGLTLLVGLMILILIPLLVLTIITFVDVKNNPKQAGNTQGTPGTTETPGTTVSGYSESTVSAPTNPSGGTTGSAKVTTNSPATKGTTTSQNAARTCQSPECLDTANILLSGLDQTADPCQDFYQFACGQWVQSHHLTEGGPSTIRSFDIVQAGINSVIAKNLSQIDPFDNSTAPSVRTAAFIYQSCQASNQKYPNPQEVLNIINKNLTGTFNTHGWPIIVQNWTAPILFDPATLIADLNTLYLVPTLLSTLVTVDAKNINTNVLYINQATLALGARDYYINPLFHDALVAYRDLIGNVSLIMCRNQTGGCSDAVESQIPQKAQEIVDYEVSLARRTVPATELRNYTAQYNNFTFSELQARFSSKHFNWTNYLNHLLGHHLDQIPPSKYFVVSQPGFVDEMLADFNNFDPVGVETIVNYLVWRFVYDNLMFVSNNPGKAFTTLKARVKEIKDLPPSPNDCANVIINYMPYVAGYVYVTNQFPDASVVILDGTNMISSLLSSFSSMLSQLDWFDKQSLTGANKKITDMLRNVAYPPTTMYTPALDKIYSIFLNIPQKFLPNDYLGVLNEVRFDVQELNFQQIMMPGDRTNFLMSPALVNAWYQPQYNSITFPAAIFNPPYYHLGNPNYVNYGAVGTIMGHELSHAFDDEGLQFFDNGTLYTWMSYNSRLGFQQQADCIRSEYNQFCYPQQFNYLCVDGTTTQGENIADNGGIVASYNAYQQYKQLHGTELPLPGLEKFTPEQMFFISYAHQWCSVSSPSAIDSEVLVDPHSPPYYRVYGVLKNFDAFGEAFNCQRGDNYYPEPIDQCPMYQPSSTVKPKPKSFPSKKRELVKNEQKLNDVCNTTGCQDAANLIKNAMNASGDPCNDFYQFACGNWIKNTQLLTGLQLTSASYQQQLAIMTNVTNYLENTVDIHGTFSKAVQTAKVVYDSCMNSKDDPTATKLVNGINSLRTNGWPIIQTSWSKPSTYMAEKLVGDLDGIFGIPTLLTSVVDADLQNPNVYSLSIDQASLTLGYRQYYIDPRYMQNLQDYTQLIINVAKQLAADTQSKVNINTIKADAQTIVNIEIELARKTAPRDERRDYGEMYHPYNLTGLQSRWPFFNWINYLDSLLDIHIDPSSIDKFIIMQPGYIDEMHGDWNYDLSPRDYVNYLVWRYVYTNLIFLGAPYSTLYQDFHRTLSNTNLLPPPQFVCMNLITDFMPYVAGDIFLKLNLPDSGMIQATSSVQNVEQAFGSMLNNVTWLDAASKKNAQNKLNFIDLEVGVAGQFVTAQSLDTYYDFLIGSILNNPNATNNFWENWNMLRYFNAHLNFQNIGKQVNRQDFLISPAAVGALYIARRNTLNVAAGLLTPPFYRSDFPQAFIYGAFGSRVGHEITLGFNDLGIQLDKYGGFGPIYTESSMDGFSLMDQCIIGQYSQDCYPDLGYLCVDGANTQGENVADNAGVIAAYTAYQNYVKVHGPEPTLPGLDYTMDQIFFLSYGQSMCEKATDSGLAAQLELDSHPPSRDRVNGALKNFDTFSDIFQCKFGDQMAPPPDQHCYIYETQYAPPPPTTPPPVVSDAPGWKLAAQQLEASVNTSLDPCMDFYAFACADWINSNPIQKNQDVNSPSSQLQTSIYQSIASIYETIATTQWTNSSIPKAVKAAAKSYHACVTSQQSTYANLTFIYNALIDSLGGWPMIEANYISPSKGNYSIFGDIGTLEGTYALATLFTSFVDVDYENVAKPALYIDEATLTLTSRDYYINPLFHETLDIYENMIYDVSYQLCQSQKCSVSNDTMRMYAKDIVRFETNIARKKTPLNERRNFKSQFNEYNITTLMKRWEGIAWDDYLTSLLSLSIDVSKLKVDFVVLSPNYVDQLDGDVLVDQYFQNLTTVTNYLGWRLVYQNIWMFPSQFAKYKTLLNLNVQALPPSPVACVDLVTGYMPFASGNVYVNANFTSINGANQQANFLSQIVINSFTALFNQLTWQDSITKVNALNKMNSMVKNFGYPDWILNNNQLDSFYNGFVTSINPDDVTDFWQILVFLQLNTARVNFQQLLQPTSRDTWDFSPAQAVAKYQPSRNAFSIGAALYNQPFYDSTFPEAVNYGSLGSIIGHELVHAFDDIGVQFGPNGTLDMWMSHQSYANFVSMADCVVEKYSTYCYPENYIDMCVNGINTQGENIASIGGIEAAYRAYQSYESAYGKEPRLPGALQDYTMEQVFFMSFARGLCSNISPGLLLLELQGSTDSPAREQVNGAMMNFYKFGEAFNCPVGSPMFPPTKDACSVYEVPPSPPFTPKPTTRTTTTTLSPPPTPSNAPGWQDAADNILYAINQTANPCDNFYQFACGNWTRKHQPTSRNLVDVYSVTQDQINSILANKLAAIDVKSPSTPSSLAAAGNIYQTCMSSKTYDANVIINAINSDFPTVNGWPIITKNWNENSNFDPYDITGRLDAWYLIPTLLTSLVDIDWKNQKQNVLYVQEGTLALGDREYYMNPYFTNVQDAYRQLILDTAYYFNNFTNPPNTKDQIEDDARAIYDFEANLARKTVSDFEKRDFDGMYNEFKFFDFEARYPEIGRPSWVSYFEELLAFQHSNWTLDSRIIVTQPGYIDELEGEIETYSAYPYANYLMWRFVFAHLQFIPAMQQSLQNFKKTLGVQALPPAESVCVDLVNAYMPYVSGYLYIQEQTETEVNQSIRYANVLLSYTMTQIVNYVNQLRYLDNTTKQDIFLKLQNIIVNLGYPEMSIDIDALNAYYANFNSTTTDSDFWTLLHHVQFIASQNNFKKLTQPTLLTDFLASPAVVSADYSYQRNSITVPAATMITPFYQSNFPMAVNFGGLGNFISRQIAHTFDDIGIQFGPTGVLNYSWIPDNVKHGFDQVTQCVVTEFGQHCYSQSSAGLCVDGVNTMEENQADIFGAMASYLAYNAYMNGTSEPRLPGLQQYTLDQIYFITYAQQHCENANTEGLQQQLVMSASSPGPDRVNGALRNIDYFGTTFNCKRGDYMFPHSNEMCLAA